MEKAKAAALCTPVIRPLYCDKPLPRSSPRACAVPQPCTCETSAQISLYRVPLVLWLCKAFLSVACAAAHGRLRRQWPCCILSASAPFAGKEANLYPTRKSSLLAFHIKSPMIAPDPSGAVALFSALRNRHCVSRSHKCKLPLQGGSFS